LKEDTKQGAKIREGNQAVPRDNYNDVHEDEKPTPAVEALEEIKLTTASLSKDAANALFPEKIAELLQTASHIRPVRTDGDEYYRAVGYRYLEQLVLFGEMALNRLLTLYPSIQHI
jgi:hypothetical protein